MADVGLDADLVLDIRQALEQTRRIERALDAATSGISVRITADTRELTNSVTSAVDAADTSVIVTGEAASLTGDVTAAVDNADTSVVVTGDASELTGDVTSAVDAGDSTVQVTGDASELTGSITSAVDAGDSTVIVTGDASQLTGAVTSAVDAGDTHVNITADPSGLNAAADAGDALNASLIASSRSGLQLRSVLATGAAAAAAAGLYGLVNAASELEQAVGGTSAIFGEFEGTVATFARGAADAAGLSEEAARRLTSGLGGLLQGFGFTQQEAAKTSVVLAQLGADLAATFGGSPEEAVQALGAALRGEFDPLEQFGVSLNVTQANLKAVELGLADSTENVDLNARAQASLALIMERSAQAQGQFGREANTTAGQLERAKAEAINAAAAVGATLQPAMNSLLQTVRSDLIPGLAELAERLGPALVSLVTALLPAFGTLTSVLTALAPVFTVLAGVIDAIPDPILAMVGTFLAFRAAAGPVGTALTTVASGLSTLKAGAVGGLAALNPLTAALAVAAVVYTGFAQGQAEAAKAERELEAQDEKLRAALTATEGAIEGITTQLSDMARAGEDVMLPMGRLGNLSVDAGGALNTAGLSAEQFADALQDADQPLESVIDRLKEGDDTSKVVAGTLDQLADSYQRQAEEALKSGIATGEWTERQRDAAIASSENADGSNNYVAALASLQERQRAAAEAEEAHTQALTDQQKALQEIAATAPAVGLLMTALQDGSQRNVGNLAALAVAASDAGLSTAELGAVLESLGGGGATSAAQLEAVAATITGLRDAAVGTLPSLQDIAGAADEFSLSGFRDELAKAYEAIVNFNENLVTIAEQGGPRLAAAAATLGPEYAAGIAEGIRSGNPAVVAEAELLLAGIEQAGADTASTITGTIGPNLAVATGQMGAAAAAAFGTSYKIDATGQIVAVESQIQGGTPGVSFRSQEMGSAGATGFETTFTPDAAPGINNADQQIAGATGQVSGTAKTVGTVSKAGFEQTFKPDPSAAIAQARATIERGGPLMRKAGTTIAHAGAQGFRDGAAAWTGSGSAAASAAVRGARSQIGPARAAGFAVGSALGSGIEAGISAWVGSIQQQARNAVLGAASAARNAARIASPSKLFADIGEQMGQGMAVGLESGASSVVRAADSLVNAAALAANDAALSASVVSPVPVAAVASGIAAGGSTGGGTTILVQVAAGAVVFQGGTPDRATVERAGTLFGDAAGRSLKFAARTGGNA